MCLSACVTLGPNCDPGAKLTRSFPEIFQRGARTPETLGHCDLRCQPPAHRYGNDTQIITGQFYSRSYPSFPPSIVPPLRNLLPLYFFLFCLLPPCLLPLKVPQLHRPISCTWRQVDIWLVQRDSSLRAEHNGSHIGVVSLSQWETGGGVSVTKNTAL